MFYTIYLVLLNFFFLGGGKILSFLPPDQESGRPKGMTLVIRTELFVIIELRLVFSVIHCVRGVLLSFIHFYIASSCWTYSNTDMKDNDIVNVSFIKINLSWYTSRVFSYA